MTSFWLFWSLETWCIGHGVILEKTVVGIFWLIQLHAIFFMHTQLQVYYYFFLNLLFKEYLLVNTFSKRERFSKLYPLRFSKTLFSQCYLCSEIVSERNFPPTWILKDLKIDIRDYGTLPFRQCLSSVTDRGYHGN